MVGLLDGGPAEGCVVRWSFASFALHDLPYQFRVGGLPFPSMVSMFFQLVQWDVYVAGDQTSLFLLRLLTGVSRTATNRPS